MFARSCVLFVIRAGNAFRSGLFMLGLIYNVLIGRSDAHVATTRKEERMYSEKKRDWGVIVAGILLVICAFICLLMPGVTLVTITMIAGASFLVSGILDVVEYIRSRNQLMLSGWVLAYAILDILIGFMFLVHPLAFSVVLPWLIGAFFAVFGVFEIVVAVKGRKAGVPMWGWAVFSGVVGVICGLTFFLSPATLSIFIALFMIMRGASLLVFGWNAGRMLL